MIRRARSALVVAALVACAALPVAGQSPEEIFERGNAAYIDGDYAAAAEAYESLLRYRIRDPRVEYNLGNAEFKRGRLGPAILHFERARRLDPTDTEILANLEHARSFTFDQVPPAETAALVGWILRLQDAAGPDRQAWVVAALVWLVTALLSWGLARPGRWNAACGWALAGLVVAVLVAGASWYTTWQRLEGQQLAVVLAEAVEVLAGPGENNATLFTVHEGLSVEVRGDAQGEWIQVALPNGLNGWIPLAAVGLV